MSSSGDYSHALSHQRACSRTRGLGRDTCGLIGAGIGASLGSFGGRVSSIWGGAYRAALAFTIYDGFDAVEFSRMVSSDPKTYCM